MKFTITSLTLVFLAGLSSAAALPAPADHISYGTLEKGNIPCSQRGASAANCKSGGQANPYHRACETGARCPHEGPNN
ncbi:hypothetical protein NX059_009213 [Plenodomus lindquistii]|nr:hypothetical protein NX059_009213 [Plenodomus lindquistii]